MTGSTLCGAMPPTAQVEDAFSRLRASAAALPLQLPPVVSALAALRAQLAQLPPLLALAGLLGELNASVTNATGTPAVRSSS